MKTVIGVITVLVLFAILGAVLAGIVFVIPAVFAKDPGTGGYPGALNLLGILLILGLGYLTGDAVLQIKK